MGRIKKKVSVVIGARPQFIKVMPLIKSAKGILDLRIIHTGQHYDYRMSKIFFKELNIPSPDCNLNVGSDSHGAQTAMMLERLEKDFARHKPALVIVFGDTNSTLAGCLAAAKMNIPVAHIEAGLRSFNRAMPEEINRVATDHLSDLLFCPTRSAARLLKKEGIKERVFVTGDVMCDAMKNGSRLYGKNKKILKKLGIEAKNYYLLTLHRGYNTDDKVALLALMKKLQRLDKKVIFPIHPRTEKAIRSFGLWGQLKKQDNISVIKPQGYIDFLTLQRHAKTIITDSGGVQKEAYLLKVPCVTLRDETEWTETLGRGANRLAGRYGGKLIEGVKAAKRSRSWKENVYGRGNASKGIVKEIRKFLKHG